MKSLIFSAILTTIVSTGLSAAEVDFRRHMQQERIQQGVYSGSLTRPEAARLEGEERRLNHDIARDRFYNGGRLTRCEQSRINRREDRISADLYRYKNNGWYR